MEKNQQTKSARNPKLPERQPLFTLPPRKKRMNRVFILEN